MDARTDAAATRTDLTPSTPWALAGLALSTLLSSLSLSVANVALPTLAEAFTVSFQAVQWLVLAYLLVVTTLVVGVGRLGDVIGRRRLLLAGLLLFTAASALCGAAPSFELLVLARAVQGIGAAIMMALTLALVGDTVAKDRTGSAMGLLATMSAIGTALGPSLGGVLIAALGWLSIFLFNLPLGLVALWLAYRHLPPALPTPRDESQRFDLVGTFLLAITLAAYALAMTSGRGTFGLLNMALLAAAAIGAVLFVVVEQRVVSPLLRPGVFRDAALTANLAAGALVATVMMATLVVGPFYLARALGLDPMRVGLVVSVGPLVVALAGMPAGRMADRFGAQRMTRIGLIGIAIGSLLLALLPTTLGVPGYLAPLIMITTGYALFQTANSTAVMSDTPAAQRGVISGLLNLARNLGFVTGASVMGAVFSQASGALDIAVADPAAVAVGMRFTFAVAATLMIAALAIVIASRHATRVSRPRD